MRADRHANILALLQVRRSDSGSGFQNSANGGLERSSSIRPIFERRGPAYPGHRAFSRSPQPSLKQRLARSLVAVESLGRSMVASRPDDEGGDECTEQHQEQ
jgi:hypothetical protein